MCFIGLKFNNNKKKIKYVFEWSLTISVLYYYLSYITFASDRRCRGQWSRITILLYKSHDHV